MKSEKNINMIPGYKEDEYKILLDRTGDMITILSLGTNPKYIYANNAHEKILGYKSEELIGKSPLQFLHPDDRLNVLGPLGDLLKEIGKKSFLKKGLKDPIKISYRFKKKDGTWIHLESTSDIISNRIFVVSRDVSSYKNYIEEIKIEKERAEMYLNIAGNLILAIDSQGMVTLINNIGCEVLGLTREEIIGKNWIENFVPKKDRIMIKKVLKEMIRNDKFLENFENNIIIKNGEQRLIKWHNTQLKDKQGKVVGTLSSGVDITEASKREKAMIDSAREWSDTFDSMSDGITVYDANFNIINVNKEVCKLLGKEKSEILGKKCFFVYRKSDSPLEICPLSASKETKTRESAEYYDDKLKKWLSVTISPVLEGDKVVKYIHIVRDISERKEIEKANAKRSDELMKFNKLAIGRELKMIELKKEIAALKNRLNEV